MRAADFDYELPEALIAQRPLPERSASRLLVLDRAESAWTDANVRDIPHWLREGDCLVLNNTRVLAARLLGRRPTGGAAEVFLLEPDGPSGRRWRALLRPGRKLPPGSVVQVGDSEVRILGETADGVRIVEFPSLDEAGVMQLLATSGRVPLPPYIRRQDDELDRDRYQTAYAREDGSVAAPTAGLHFDQPLLDAVRTEGVTLAEITLHVGLGTFRPVSAELVEDHRMHAERFEVPESAAASIRAARRTVAVGTTSVRTLETVAATNDGTVRAGRGETDMFITPGHRFRAVDALLTNFHLPRSTLLMLVAAFAGRELVLSAYAHAVRERYRFYSYGDCMLII